MSKVINVIPATSTYGFSYEQSNQASASGTSQTCAFSSNVVAGDLLIACVDVFGQAITGISDSQGNTWTAIPGTPIEQSTTGPRYTAMYYAVAGSSGADTITVTFNQVSSGSSVIMLAAYTPSGGTAALDTSGTASTTSGASLTATTGSATYPQDLLVAFIDAFSGITTPCGYTQRQDVGPNSGRLMDSVATDDGVQSVTVTFGSANAAGLILAAFSATKSTKLRFSVQ
jgi:hypothetical protein